MNAVTQAVKNKFKLHASDERRHADEPTTYPVYQVMANRLIAWHNCHKSSVMEEFVRILNLQKHEDRLDELVREYLPSGSGFDNGTKLNYDRSTPDKLVFETSFHHMDNHGGYDGWTEHVVVVRPSLAHGFVVDVTGRNRNDVKTYIVETFNHVLRTKTTY